MEVESMDFGEIRRKWAKFLLSDSLAAKGKKRPRQGQNYHFSPFSSIMGRFLSIFPIFARFSRFLPDFA